MPLEELLTAIGRVAGLGFIGFVVGPVVIGALSQLAGLAWALVFHFLNGVRHLAWDLGYGFPKETSERNSVIILVLSIVGALAIFAIAWTGHGGYLK